MSSNERKTLYSDIPGWDRLIITAASYGVINVKLSDVTDSSLFEELQTENYAQLLAYASMGNAAFLNGKPIVPPERNTKDCLKIVVSPYLVHESEMKWALDLFDYKSFVKVRSTMMKALRIFAGEADLFFGLPGVPVHSWDLAAVVIIAEQSGYVLTDIKGERINLNHEESIWPHGFILCNELIHNFAVDRLSQW